MPKPCKKPVWFKYPVNPQLFSDTGYVQKTVQKISHILPTLRVNEQLPLDYLVSLVRLLFLHYKSEVETKVQSWQHLRNLYCSAVWKSLVRTTDTDEIDGGGKSKSGSTNAGNAGMQGTPKSAKDIYVVPTIDQLLDKAANWDSLRSACDICAFSPFELQDVKVLKSFDAEFECPIDKNTPIKDAAGASTDVDFDSTGNQRLFQMSSKAEESKTLFGRLISKANFESSKELWERAPKLIQNAIFNFYLAQTNAIYALIFGEHSLLLQILEQQPEKHVGLQQLIAFLLKCLEISKTTDIDEQMLQTFLNRFCMLQSIKKYSKIHLWTIARINSMFPNAINQLLASKSIECNMLTSMSKVGIICDKSAETKSTIKSLLVIIVLGVSSILTAIISHFCYRSSEPKVPDSAPATSAEDPFAPDKENILI